MPLFYHLFNLVDIADGNAYKTGQNDPVLQALVITLIFVLLGLAAHVTALIALAYWDHFVIILYFNS
jgi:multisubunit Na+/H+ antiporter MnhC subunit